MIRLFALLSSALILGAVACSSSSNEVRDKVAQRLDEPSDGGDAEGGDAEAEKKA